MTNNEFDAVVLLKNTDPQTVVNKGRLVAAQLTANSSDFASPDPAPADIDAQVDALQGFLNRRETLRKEAQAVEGKIADAVEALKGTLKAAANYVAATAKATNDPSLIEKGGFSHRAEPKPTTEVEVPQNLKLTEIKNTSGALAISVKSVKRAKGYTLSFCYDTLENATWTTGDFFSSSVGIRLLLERGKKVFVRIKAHGPNNTASDWSDIATRIVP
jgi:hypothetical protein